MQSKLQVLGLFRSSRYQRSTDPGATRKAKHKANDGKLSREEKRGLSEDRKEYRRNRRMIKKRG